MILRFLLGRTRAFKGGIGEEKGKDGVQLAGLSQRTSYAMFNWHQKVRFRPFRNNWNVASFLRIFRFPLDRFLDIETRPECIDTSATSIAFEQIGDHIGCKAFLAGLSLTRRRGDLDIASASIAR